MGSRAWASGVVADGLSSTVACGTFPDQGWNPRLLRWRADSTTGPPGKPIITSFWLKDFFKHFLYCKSAGDSFFQLLYIWKWLDFAFVSETYFYWVQNSRWLFFPPFKCWSPVFSLALLPERLAVILVFVPIDLMWPFSLSPFKIVFLTTGFEQFDYDGVNFLMFLVLGFYWTSWIWDFIVFINLKNLGPLILYLFLCPTLWGLQLHIDLTSWSCPIA